MLLQNTPESQSSPMETKVFPNLILDSFCTLIQELSSINPKNIMSDYQSNFELPNKIEHHLATLSKIYSQDGKTQLQELLVNSRIRVHEELNYDSWDGGTYGHGLIFVVPEVLYLKTVKQKATLQDQIKNDINQIHNIHNEYIAQVIFEIEEIGERDWRKESGLLLSGERVVFPEAENRIWGKNGFRVFLSHKANIKREAAGLKKRLRTFGISGFVAHEDIRPNKEWQNEIENALSSMNALVALMTEGFHESDWTDQEIGFAFGRGLPIVAVKLGMDPYGFLGKFQALSCNWETSATEIAKVLIQNPNMLNAYIESVQKCSCFGDGNSLSEILPSINNLTFPQAKELVKAYNTNKEVRGSFGFNGTKPQDFGNGLLFHLKRMTSHKYTQSSSERIEVERW